MSRTRGHRKSCSHRSCFACSRADAPKRILARAPSVDEAVAEALAEEAEDRLFCESLVGFT